MVEYAILFLIVASLPHKPHWRHIIFSCEKKISYFLCSNCISTSDESVQDGHYLFYEHISFTLYNNISR